ncbi:MAG: glycosyltransferase family 4 protein [Nitrospiraceae bacterium]|nr:glycosyltransferase family 4 protein [Nitrospiraceae bacterium]
MRVLIVNPSLSVYGGAELLIVRLANYLTENGVENGILTTSILPEIRFDLKDTKIILREKSPTDRIGQIIALNRAIKAEENRFDVINIHNFPSEISVFGCKRPVVWMCNEPELHISVGLPFSLKFKAFLMVIRPFEEFVVKNYISRVAVADEFNAKRFKTIFGVEPTIISYGIDSEFFSVGDAEKAKREFALIDKFVILQIGMLTPMKNQLESLRTLKTLIKRIPNAMLVLAGSGEGDYKTALHDYIWQNDLQDYALFTGHLNRQKLRDLIHASDVILHPIKEQGGWLSPFEALCAKKPVVVSSEMTASEIISRERIGVVAADYATAIMNINNDSAQYEAMAARGAAFVKDNLSWEKFSEKMLGLFLDACAGF